MASSTAPPLTATTFTENTRINRLNVFRELLTSLPRKPEHIFDPIKAKLAQFRQMNEAKITEVISEVEVLRADKIALEEELARADRHEVQILAHQPP